MKLGSIRRWALCTGGIAAVALVLAPFTPAFSVIGFVLDLGQRDVRVFDNFTSTNTTPDPNWPGYVGAPLAIWKAVAEWGSELHGDGSGDPHQPFGVGSGGANFDVTWQGLSPDVGPLTGNVVSLTSACGGGITGFSEFGPNGWRIQLCDTFDWFDGPGTTVPPNMLDLQGVVCHEYGHALGLGHSTVNGATMFPSITGAGVSHRSLATDDINGVQSLYGSQSPAKPHIASITGTTTLTITGANFASTGNEVWFTQANINPTGEPVRVTGLNSSAGGTQITLALPASAGPGDVLVRRPGAGGNSLSNAFPFAPSGCGEPATYCTAKLNSQGCTPAIASSGTPSATNPAPFLITASNVINNKTGLLVYAYASAATPFQGGTLCLGGQLKRTPAQNSFGNPGADDCSGTYSFDFNARIQSGIDPALVVGVNVYAQYLSRDTADPFGLGLTDAIVFTVCP